METSENKGVIYEFGKFTLDPSERTLSSNGDAIRLPAKVFDTLVLLVEHNGHSISKDRMISELWKDSFVEEGNLTRQISELRKVLNAGGDAFIETLPKHGYRFNAELRTKIPTPDDEVIAEKRTIKRVTLAVENEPAQLTAPTPLPTWRTIAIAAGLFLLTIVAFAVWREWKPSIPTIKTVAVLPLRSLGGDEDSRAIGLGLSDTLITKLGSLKRIIVRPTNAVTPFPDQSDALETGRKLGVDAILEGTIQKAEGKLRVNARLLNTTTGEQIWADKFEEASGGIFAIEDEMSASISQALAFELTKSDSEELHHRGTTNTDAYEKYLRGRFYQTQNTPEGFGKSIELYQQAIALDPNFAEAFAGLGDANILMFNFGAGHPEETIPAARQSVDHALRLNSQLSNAYTSRALIEFLIDHDWPKAEGSLQKAIELNANNADALVRYGFFLTSVGRFDDAIDKLEKAKELNPLSPIVQTDIGLAHLYARQYSKAIAELEKTAAENPKFSLPEWLLAASYEGAGDKDKAFDANLKALETEGDADLADRLRKVRETEGLDAADRFWFKETLAERLSHSEPMPALLVARQAAAIKDRDQTLSWVEKAREEDDPALAEIRFLAEFDFVRDDPRFQAVEATLPS